MTFSLLALGVALVGVHGVLRFSVAQRTREMGIRKALGATSFDFVALIVGHALRFAVAGCVVGLVAAVAAGPAIGSLLFGITPADPLTLAAATALLITAVIVAAYLPARPRERGRPRAVIAVRMKKVCLVMTRSRLRNRTTQD